MFRYGNSVGNEPLINARNWTGGTGYASASRRKGSNPVSRLEPGIDRM